VLSVQVKRELAVLPSITAVLLHHSALDTGTASVLFAQGIGNIAVRPTVTAVLLRLSMDTGTVCSVVI